MGLCRKSFIFSNSKIDFTVLLDDPIISWTVDENTEVIQFWVEDSKTQYTTESFASTISVEETTTDDTTTQDSSGDDTSTSSGLSVLLTVLVILVVIGAITGIIYAKRK